MPQLGSDEKPMKLTPNRVGKGSRVRPSTVSRQEFADNWDKIFNKKKNNAETKEKEK
jgi:hypothetical protein